MGERRPPNPGGAIVFLIALAISTSALAEDSLDQSVHSTNINGTCSASAATNPKESQGISLLQGSRGNLIKKVVDHLESFTEVDDAVDVRVTAAS